jgi:uroporphyrinogen III methyltransferase / synthase
MNRSGGRGGAAADRGGPLQGKRIVVTRPKEQAGTLAAALEEAGAEVILAAAIRIEGSRQPERLVEAAREASGYDWIVFTSANAVTRFREALGEAGLAVDELSGVRICAVGSATARALERTGVRVDAVPGEHVAEGLAGAMTAVAEVRGKRILYPRAEGAREVASVALRALGARVDEVVAYRTVPDAAAGARLRSVLAAGGVDMITFASGSAVNAFVEQVGAEVGGARIATIGPVTSARCRALDLPVHVEASPHTAAGLVASIVDYYTRAGER